MSNETNTNLVGINFYPELPIVSIGKVRSVESVTKQVDRDMKHLGDVHAAAMGLLGLGDKHSGSDCAVECVGMPANSKTNPAVITAAQALLADMYNGVQVAVAPQPTRSGPARA